MAAYTSHHRLQGNSQDRRRRKLWMLSEASGFGGNGDTVPCTHCGCELTYETVTADRIVPGSQGGTYTRSNIRPMCLSGNSSRQDRTDWDAINVLIINA